MPSSKTGWYHVETFAKRSPADEFVRIYKAQGEKARVVKRASGYEVQLYVVRPYTRADEARERRTGKYEYLVVKSDARAGAYDARFGGEVIDGPFDTRAEAKAKIEYFNASMGTHGKLKVVRVSKDAGYSSSGVWMDEARGSAANDDNVRELVLYIDNDGDLYRSQATPIMKNLAKKILKGTYDSAKAVKLWKYLADAGAKKYTKEFDSPGGANGAFGAFSAADRKAAAEELSDAFEKMVENGEFDLEKLAKG